jgi:hypothetical protein
VVAPLRSDAFVPAGLRPKPFFYDQSPRKARSPVETLYRCGGSRRQLHHVVELPYLLARPRQRATPASRGTVSCNGPWRPAQATGDVVRRWGRGGSPSGAHTAAASVSVLFCGDGEPSPRARGGSRERRRAPGPTAIGRDLATSPARSSFGLARGPRSSRGACPACGSHVRTRTLESPRPGVCRPVPRQPPPPRARHLEGMATRGAQLRDRARVTPSPVRFSDPSVTRGRGRPLI